MTQVDRSRGAFCEEIAHGVSGFGRWQQIVVAAARSVAAPFRASRTTLVDIGDRRGPVLEALPESSLEGPLVATIDGGCDSYGRALEENHGGDPKPEEDTLDAEAANRRRNKSLSQLHERRGVSVVEHTRGRDKPIVVGDDEKLASLNRL